MKKLLTALLLGTTISMNAALKIDRIEPTDWYVGMKDASLQLMVYGQDIRRADVFFYCANLYEKRRKHTIIYICKFSQNGR